MSVWTIIGSAMRAIFINDFLHFVLDESQTFTVIGQIALVEFGFQKFRVLHQQARKTQEIVFLFVLACLSFQS